MFDLEPKQRASRTSEAAVSCEERYAYCCRIAHCRYGFGVRRRCAVDTEPGLATRRSNPAVRGCIRSELERVAALADTLQPGRAANSDVLSIRPLQDGYWISYSLDERKRTVRLMVVGQPKKAASVPCAIKVVVLTAPFNHWQDNQFAKAAIHGAIAAAVAIPVKTG